AVLTMLDPDVVFDLAQIANGQPANGNSTVVASSLLQDIERAQKIGREVTVHAVKDDPGREITRLIIDGDYDLVVLDSSATAEGSAGTLLWQQYIRDHASCLVCLLSMPAIPREVVDSTPSTVVATVDRSSTGR